MKMKHFAAIMALFPLAMMGCNTTPTQDGAVVGTALGAGLGAIIGHQSGHQGEGALIGAGLGALTGAIIGDATDNRGAHGRVVQRTTVTETVAPRTAPAGHYEMHLVTTPSGETYEKRVWVPHE